MADSPLMKRLRRRARAIGSRALDEILSSDQRADAMGAAVRRVQEGRRMIDEQGARVLGALGLATQPDLDRVSRKVGRVRKRLEALLDGLDEA